MFTLQMYIEHKGVNQVAREVGVEPTAVSAWKSFKSAPRPHLASLLIEMTNGLLTWESVYQPYVDHNNEKQIEMDLGESLL
jgi:transposase-like protein